jgi:hypothetical protein
LSAQIKLSDVERDSVIRILNQIVEHAGK